MKDGGGPAFPSPEVRTADGVGIYEAQFGISIRDWFAGQALLSMTAKGDEKYSLSDHNIGLPRQHAIWLASAAYRIADAMLEARKK